MREAVQLDWKPEKPLLLDQRQVALYLNVSERTVRNLIRARKLPVKYIGKPHSKNPRALIPTAAVEAFARKTAGA